MRLLEKEFISRGFRFTQRQRNDNFAIYLKENNAPVDSPLYYFCYEVIKIIKRDAESGYRFGTSIELPQRELYPNDKSWGLQGWTFESFSTAETYYIKLSEKVATPTNLNIKNSTLDEYQFSIF